MELTREDMKMIRKYGSYKGYRKCRRAATHDNYCRQHALILTGGWEPTRNAKPWGQCIEVVKDRG